MASADGGEQERSGSQLAEPDATQIRGGGQQMPERLTILITKAFEKKYAFAYVKIYIASEITFVCTKGSQWARPKEFLVLRRCETGPWIAYDGALGADGTTLRLRQSVFRCLAADITQPGWHNWETNHAASPNGAGLAVDWQGALSAETRGP